MDAKPLTKQERNKIIARYLRLEEAESKYAQFRELCEEMRMGHDYAYKSVYGRGRL